LAHEDEHDIGAKNAGSAGSSPPHDDFLPL